MIKAIRINPNTTDCRPAGDTESGSQSFAIEMPSRPPYKLSKQLQTLLDRLGLAGKTVVVDAQPTNALMLSGRNIRGVKIVDPSQLNVYDVLDCKNLLVSTEALTKLEERLTP